MDFRTLAYWTSRSTAERVRDSTQLAIIPVLLLTFVVATALNGVLTARQAEDVVAPSVRGPGGRPLPVTKRKKVKVQEPRALVRRPSSWFFWAATILLILTYLGNAVNTAIHAINGLRGRDPEDPAWWCGEPEAAYLAGALYIHTFIFTTLFDRFNSPNAAHYLTWTLAMAGEVIILMSSYIAVNGPHHVISDFRKGSIVTRNGPSEWESVDLVLGLIRACTISSIVLLCVLLNLMTRSRLHCHFKEGDIEGRGSNVQEATPLLGRITPGYETNGNGNGNGYRHLDYRRNSKRRRAASEANGTNGAAKTGDSGNNANGCHPGAGQNRDDFAAFYRPEKLPHKTWWEYVRGYSVFFPYIWPSKKWKLQALMFICFLLVLAQRAVNMAVPFQQGRLVQAIANSYERGQWEIPYGELFRLLLLKLLQGQSGLLGSARSFIWIPVSQYSYRALTAAAFEHVHSLSLDFHLGKRTGEVLSALNKGSSINSFLEQTTFQVFPMLMDLFLAIIFFQSAYGTFYGLMATMVTHIYLVLTIKMASTRADQRRDMVNADREEEAVKNDSITSYETVKYFNAEQFEFRRYREAIKTFQAAEAKVTVGMNLMNLCQSLLFMAGLLVVLLTAAFQVAMKIRTVGDFITIMAYMNQMQGPLNFFGTFYRTVQQAMISGERLLELFKIQPTVVDKEGAQPLPYCQGRIRWNRVKFWYDKTKPALNNISFECLPGTTTAFVGESGGGKSTIFRLMFRYYNCHAGSIEIDGQDVTDLTIDSVRRHIGVVPQDTILFNETVMYNLKYANPSASDEEVYEACRAASIHDRIMSFRDGYFTKVGERGLRLSGGEKQRVAIARTILKRPRIIMLDEATSALDSETEQHIQSRLIKGHLGQDRTMLIIAHRLSTITHADQIVVLQAGEIVEKGTHDELLALKGKYASMWEKQARAEEAAEQARAATTRANKLLRQANIGGNDHGEDSSSDGCSSMASSSILQSGSCTPDEGSSARPDLSTPGILTDAAKSTPILDIRNHEHAQ
ncbi:Heavy metal tolerance protein [Pleurostoma richardsiae]|uniref:Heavy metal tolerance protein n=1 Tax=Pleurostoma richardsiae TaxID=41990 RepID=A0AA38VJE5_9PEZI|nr:Heavy metal tolerance protein [Pleurostoma richardsiae]